MKAKLQSMGFSLAHAQLIGVAVVIFAILVVTQTGVSIKGMFASADSEKPMLTYESVRAEVLAKNSGSSSQGEVDAENARQLAMLDLSDDGEVLGVNSDFPSADQIFTPDVMSKIQIKHSALTGNEAIQKYADQVLYIESNTDVLALLSNMNSEDHGVIEKSQASTKEMIGALAQVPVPTGLEDFHRYKMMYYTTLRNIGDIWLGKLAETELQTQSTILFSLTEKIESIKATVQKNNSISL